MQARAIDWSTAEVTPAPPLFELHVAIVPGDVDEEWRARFNELAKRHALATHRAPRWGAVELADETVTVVAVEPDGDVELKRTLDALAAETNAELERERVRREEEERRRLEEEAEQERVARELTERFRRSVPSAAAAEQRQPPPPFRS